MLGFKALHSASATIAGKEVTHMMRTKQFANDNISPFGVFAELAVTLGRNKTAYNSLKNCDRTGSDVLSRISYFC